MFLNMKLRPARILCHMNIFVTLSHMIITCLSCWFNQSGVSISRTIGIIWAVCNLSHRSFDRMMTRKSFRISFRPISGTRRMSSCSRQWRWNGCWMWTDQRICRIHRIGAELRVNSRSINGRFKVNSRSKVIFKLTLILDPEADVDDQAMLFLLLNYFSFLYLSTFDLKKQSDPCRPVGPD